MTIFKCTNCHKDKDVSEFYSRKDNPLGHRKDCKECVIKKSRKNYYKDIELSRERHRLTYKNKGRYQNYQKKYGITKECFQSIVEEQDGKCWICSKYDGEFLHVDHCHETGKYRGVICWECNMGIGLFKDKESNLLKAIEYLKRNDKC